MSVLIEFSMTPLDKGEAVSKFVSRSIDIIDRSGVDYSLGPMGTCLEGEWDEVMGVVKQCYDRMSEDCRRVSVSIKMDCRKERSAGLKNKIASIEKYLGREVVKSGRKGD